MNNRLQAIEIIQVQLRALCLRREVQLQADLSFAIHRVWQYFPLEESNVHVDTIFETPETQRVVLEAIFRELRMKAIRDPSESEICNVTMDLCWSQYARAHMVWERHPGEMYVFSLYKY